MAKDALLGLTGPVGQPGNPIEAAAVTVDADGSKGWVYVGKYRTGYVELRLAGAFDRTTGDESLVGEIYEATDAAGTGSTLIASSPSLTATHAAQVDENTANGKTAGTLSTGPTRIGFSTGSGGWIKYRSNVSGTTPSAASVSADVVMLADAYLQSGS